ncbi:MAG: nucleotidyltransferase domain-containing protein, partial [Pseudomonadota bacterium]
MDSVSYIKNLDAFQKLTNLEFVDEIWLYGSRARGDDAKTADIDLAILYTESADWQKVVDIIENADTLLKIDYINFGTLPSNSEFRNNILRD